MSSETRRVVAVDLGATSGRVMVAEVGPDTLTLEEVHRFPNGPVDVGGSLHWDVLGLHREVLAGLRLAAAGGPVDGIGIDSWAIDYGLLDAGEELLGNPFAYRDSRTDGVAAQVLNKVDARELYDLTGVQQLPFNTIYQLVAAAGTPALEQASTMLLLPDLLGFWLTGSVGAERTNASTTGLYDVRSREWATDLADRVGIPSGILPPLLSAGDRLGTLLPDVADGGRAARRRPGDRGRLARHRLRGGGRPRRRRAVGVHLLGHVVAGRPRAGRAGPDRGRAPGRLHERGRRRRHDPVPEERDGAVGAVGVLACAGATPRPAGPPGERRSRGPAADRGRHQRPAPAAAGRHARPDRPQLAPRGG